MFTKIASCWSRICTIQASYEEIFTKLHEPESKIVGLARVRICKSPVGLRIIWHQKHCDAICFIRDVQRELYYVRAYCPKHKAIMWEQQLNDITQIVKQHPLSLVFERNCSHVVVHFLAESECDTFFRTGCAIMLRIRQAQQIVPQIPRSNLVLHSSNMPIEFSSCQKHEAIQIPNLGSTPSSDSFDELNEHFYINKENAAAEEAQHLAKDMTKCVRKPKRRAPPLPLLGKDECQAMRKRQVPALLAPEVALPSSGEAFAMQTIAQPMKLSETQLVDRDIMSRGGSSENIVTKAEAQTSNISLRSELAVYGIRSDTPSETSSEITTQNSIKYAEPKYPKPKEATKAKALVSNNTSKSNVNRQIEQCTENMYSKMSERDLSGWSVLTNTSVNFSTITPYDEKSHQRPHSEQRIYNNLSTELKSNSSSSIERTQNINGALNETSISSSQTSKSSMTLPCTLYLENGIKLLPIFQSPIAPLTRAVALKLPPRTTSLVKSNTKATQTETLKSYAERSTFVSPPMLAATMMISKKPRHLSPPKKPLPPPPPPRRQAKPTAQQTNQSSTKLATPTKYAALFLAEKYPTPPPPPLAPPPPPPPSPPRAPTPPTSSLRPSLKNFSSLKPTRPNARVSTNAQAPSLHEQTMQFIRNGVRLRPPRVKSRVPDSVHDKLMEEIRRGVRLKPVTIRKRASPNQPYMSFLHVALQKMATARQSSDEGEENIPEDTDDWTH